MEIKQPAVWSKSSSAQGKGPAEQENEHRDAQASADACITEKSAPQAQTCLNALEASCENLSACSQTPAGELSLQQHSEAVCSASLQPVSPSGLGWFWC